MKYEITRTSDWYGTHQPCLGAILSGTDEWNHNIWKIEINGIDDLKELMRQTSSPLILNRDDSIEIYDGYRE